MHIIYSIVLYNEWSVDDAAHVVVMDRDAEHVFSWREVLRQG